MRLVKGRQAEIKRRKGLCLVYGCNDKGYKRKNKKKRWDYCNKHYHEHRKERNPLTYWYAVLRRNARRRGKVFTITLDDFKKFCDETGYLEKKGRQNGRYTIDRKIDELGYIPGNIRILEHGANIRKYHVDYFKHHPDFDILPPEEDLPF